MPGHCHAVTRCCHMLGSAAARATVGVVRRLLFGSVSGELVVEAPSDALVVR